MAADGKYKILAVDDEATNLMALNGILSTDYAVITAKSGSEALARAEEDHPDLIVLDIIMPEMDGFEVLERLKVSETTQNIPVIIISGLTAEDDEERGFSLGAVDYIIKPFRNAIVLARIKTHIQIIRQMRVIERTGLVDALTDIPNRRSFDNRIEMEWKRCARIQKPISFLMMDLDKFKSYNDSYGHQQGDALLKTVAKVFASSARRPSDMAARLGGEEFGVLLPETDSSGAAVIAEKIRKNVESLRIPTSDGKTITTATVSIGINTTIPHEKDLIREFLVKADENLYAAKNSGRNKICS
jgi:diguanylate cyclase (GGDEF)-like protein